MTFALVLINCYPERVYDIKKKVRDVKGVVESHPTGGVYEMVLKVKTRNEKELRNAIKSVTMVSGIVSILTSIVYNVK